MIILFFIYDIIFFIGFLLYLPLYIYRGKINIPTVLSKLGLGLNVKYNKSIWVQAVSVGEINLIAGLLTKLKGEYGLPIVISTTTLSGYQAAEKKYSNQAKIVFFPFDLTFVIERYIHSINPVVFIAIETEIWPNLFYCLGKKNIPIVIMNGRISDRAFSRYKIIRPITRAILNQCSKISVQNEFYKDRFVYLGANKDNIFVTGNLKFEPAIIDETKLYQLKQKIFPLVKKDNEFFMVAASTHHPEEQMILSVYQDVCKAGKKMSLLIAPRHLERIESIEKDIVDKGFNPVRISKANNYIEQAIYVLDTVGELMYFYALCDFCFVGGSLVKYGGHNILEPMFFSKPTLFGPHMHNFTDIAELALAKQAAIQVNNAEDLRENIIKLISNNNFCKELHRRCREVFSQEQNALENNMRLIRDFKLN